MYRVREVDGCEYAETIRRLNGMAPETFPPLTDNHLENGFWWLVDKADDVPVAFAGMVPFEPFPNIGYLKRAFVLPDHRGGGLQSRLIMARECKARQLGWTHLVSECSASNTHSATNFARSGYSICEPEQPWAINSIYWLKALI